MSYRYHIEVALRGDRAVLERVYAQGLIYETEATSGEIVSAKLTEDRIMARISTYCRYADLDAWEALAEKNGLRLDCLISCGEKGCRYSTDPDGSLFGQKKYHVLLRLGRAARERFGCDYISAEGATIEELVRNVNAKYGAAFADIAALYTFYERECHREPVEDPCQFDPPSFWCWKDPTGNDDETTRKYFG